MGWTVRLQLLSTDMGARFRAGAGWPYERNAKKNGVWLFQVSCSGSFTEEGERRVELVYVRIDQLMRWVARIASDQMALAEIHDWEFGSPTPYCTHSICTLLGTEPCVLLASFQRSCMSSTVV
jgi:hypothetical protein